MRLVPTDHRIHVLDIARGLAIFGILLINMTFYSTSLQAIQWQVVLWPDAWNQAVQAVLNLVAEGKFLAIFAFLFGYGTILLRDRNLQKGRRFGPLYLRRLLALVVFGLIHGWFIWFGDILFHYALLGFVLLAFVNRRPKTLLVWAVALLTLLPTLILVGGGSTQPAADPELQALIQEWITHDTAVYGSGTYAEIQAQRRADWASSAMNQVVFYPQILGMFVLGAYFAKRRLLHDVSTSRDVLKRIARWTGFIGVLLTLLPSVLALLRPEVTAQTGVLDVLQYLLGAPILGLFYILAVALLTERTAWQKTMLPLADVGRMAFTNYIMQSVVCTLIFYGYGGGWYGKVGPLAGALMAIGVFGAQVLWSRMWMKWFRMGPLEWVWRAVTYLSIPTIVQPRTPTTTQPNQTV